MRWSNQLYCVHNLKNENKLLSQLPIRISFSSFQDQNDHAKQKNGENYHFSVVCS